MLRLIAGAKQAKRGTNVISRSRLTKFTLRALVFIHCVWTGHESEAQSVAPAQQNTKPASLTETQITKSSLNFISLYCGDCHRGGENEGDRDFDLLETAISDDSSLVLYQEIIDQLNLGRMPPRDSKQPQPGERLAFIKEITDRIREYHATRVSNPSRTTLRRLNSREYRNTIRDLFSMNMLMFDPTYDFPRDQTRDQFDNQAETLLISGHLLQAYLDAADQIVRRASGPIDKPQPATWNFTDNFKQQPEIDQVHGKTNGFTHLTLYDVIHADKHEGAYAPIHQFADGVPSDGFYDITFEAEAMNREHPYDPDFLGINPDEPLRLGIVAGHRDAGTLHLPQPIEPLLAQQVLEDRRRFYQVIVWLDEGFTPRFTFPNGLMDARNLWGRLIRKYPDQFPPGSNQGIVKARYNAIDLGKLPHIRIYEVKIEGPIVETWPTTSQRAIFGELLDSESTHSRLDGWMRSAEDYHLQLSKFTTKAFRRPASKAETHRFIEFFETQIERGASGKEAYLDTVKAILCSPGCLYLDATTEKVNGKTWLSPHALASRLSYFLWSSAPDTELIQLANEGKILDSNVLKSQVDRMLRDRKSQAFIEGFLDSWLGLRDLGSTPPDRRLFNKFYHKDLDQAMRRETQLFTSYLLSENLPSDQFLDSDFTFVNASLARHYGIREPSPHGFQKVTLTERNRGGLLGQASILTLTANGLETSPVVRGVLVLRHLLGLPPAPPPPDVEPLDPDIRGAKTIREQLGKHRDNPACMTCHQDIDPIGFALENFDPIGGFRSEYAKGRPIDASGELPDGSRFTNLVELKQELLKRKKFFHLALAKQLLAYGIGRQTDVLSRNQIETILKQTGPNLGFRDLVTQTVLSDTFRKP